MEVLWKIDTEAINTEAGYVCGGLIRGLKRRIDTYGEAIDMEAIDMEAIDMEAGYVCGGLMRVWRG